MKLVILPVESDEFPRLAEGLNTAMRDVRVATVTDAFVSTVTLEVVQLSIECVEAWDGCYTLVGKSLGAQRLVFADIGSISSKKKKKRSVRVTVTLYDVERGAAEHTSTKAFISEEAASAGIGALVRDVASHVGKPMRTAASR